VTGLSLLLWPVGRSELDDWIAQERDISRSEAIRPLIEQAP
jgi:hypothetical protein